MKENKCLACGYTEDGTPLGEFVEVQGIRGEDIDKAIACPVCGTVRVMFNYDYYDPKPAKEEQELETMRRCKDHGVDYMDIIGKHKNEANRAEDNCGESSSFGLGVLTNDFDF